MVVCSNNGREKVAILLYISSHLLLHCHTQASVKIRRAVDRSFVGDPSGRGRRSGPLDFSRNSGGDDRRRSWSRRRTSENDDEDDDDAQVGVVASPSGGHKVAMMMPTAGGVSTASRPAGPAAVAGAAASRDSAAMRPLRPGALSKVNRLARIDGRASNGYPSTCSSGGPRDGASAAPAKHVKPATSGVSIAVAQQGRPIRPGKPSRALGEGADPLAWNDDDDDEEEEEVMVPRLKLAAPIMVTPKSASHIKKGVGNGSAAADDGWVERGLVDDVLQAAIMGGPRPSSPRMAATSVAAHSKKAPSGGPRRILSRAESQASACT